MRKRAVEEAVQVAELAAQRGALRVVERWNSERSRCGRQRSGAPSPPERRGWMSIVRVARPAGRSISAPWIVTRWRRSEAWRLAYGARGVRAMRRCRCSPGYMRCRRPRGGAGICQLNSYTVFPSAAVKSDACIVLIGSRRCTPLRPLRRAFNTQLDTANKTNLACLTKLDTFTPSGVR